MTRKKIVCVCIDQACTKLTFSNEHSQVVIYNKNTGILWYDLGIADAEISGLHFKDGILMIRLRLPVDSYLQIWQGVVLELPL